MKSKALACWLPCSNSPEGLQANINLFAAYGLDKVARIDLAIMRTGFYWIRFTPLSVLKNPGDLITLVRECARQELQIPDICTDDNIALQNVAIYLEDAFTLNLPEASHLRQYFQHGYRFVA